MKKNTYVYGYQSEYSYYSIILFCKSASDQLVLLLLRRLADARIRTLGGNWAMVSIHMFTNQPVLADSEPVDWQLDIEAILRLGP